MYYMAVLSGKGDFRKEGLVKNAFKFHEGVESKGIAELHGSWLAHDLGLMWCTWETENVKALEAAFADLPGVRTELKPIEKIYPT